MGGGAAGILLPGPHFFPYQQEDLEVFCRRFAEQVPLPVLLYNLPQFTSNLSADYEVGKWSLTGRARHFGDWTYVASTSATNPVYEDIGAETFFDLIGNYQFSDSVNVTVGVENALDNYTQHTQLVTERNNGRLYPRGVPYENEGRQVYARVGIRF